MAKKLKATPDGDDAKSIPNRDEEAVFLSHINKLRVQEAKKAVAKAALDVEAQALTDLFRIAKADGFSRKELQAILDDGKSSRRDLTAEEERRAKLRTWAGLPAGTQPDLFGLPDAARDSVDAEAQGYAMGLRGEDEVAPDWVQPAHLPDFSQGWRRAQTRLAEKFDKSAANDDLSNAEVADAA